MLITLIIYDRVLIRCYPCISLLSWQTWYVTRHCVQGDKYRGRNAAGHVSSRKNVSVEQRAKFGADRKRSASAGTSSRGTRSSKNENSVKRRAIRSQDPHERFLSSRKESKKNAKTLEHAPAYKARLFTDETSDVGSASNDDPIYNLRKEIRDWRAAVQLNEFERCITEDGTKKNALRGKV